MIDYITHGCIQSLKSQFSLAVRHGVHREGGSETRHVDQSLHVPRRLQLWLHEWSPHWSFLQIPSPQLRLVTLCHKQMSRTFLCKIAVMVRWLAAMCVSDVCMRWLTEERSLSNPADGSARQLIYRMWHYCVLQIMTLPCLKLGSTLQSTICSEIYCLDTAVS